MKRKTSALAAAALLALVVQAAGAGENVVGYNRVEVPAASDARVTVPFNQKIEGAYTVTATTGTGVTVGDTLETNEYANAYYVRFTTGDASGLWSTITSNDTSNMVLEDLNVLALVSVGDEFRVYRHETLGSLFPKGLYGVSFVTGTQVFLYENDIDAMAKNKSSVKAAGYSAALGRWAGAGVNNDTVLEPETQLVVRNNSTTETLTVITHGVVPDHPVSLLAAPDGDLVMGTGYPVPLVLKDAGLEGANRQMFFYDNSAVGKNKSSVAAAGYSTALGRWAGAGITGNELITPSEVVTLRLPSSETATKITVRKPY